MHQDRQNVSCSALAARLRCQPPAGLSQAEMEHLSACGSCAELLLLQALEQETAVEVPAGFAARVCANLPAPEPAAAPGRRSAFRLSLLASAVIACIASLGFALAPRLWIPSGNTGILLGIMLLTELVGLSLWLGTPRASR